MVVTRSPIRFSWAASCCHHWVLRSKVKDLHEDTDSYNDLLLTQRQLKEDIGFLEQHIKTAMLSLLAQEGFDKVLLFAEPTLVEYQLLGQEI